ncbi:MAG: hypothetical protein AAF152_06275 [Cyanobacteria bacterium P01_A01_bin.114]
MSPLARKFFKTFLGNQLPVIHQIPNLSILDVRRSLSRAGAQKYFALRESF